MFKSIGVAAVAMALAGAACAHDSDPTLEPDPALAAMRYCQTIGVRAAWGARAFSSREHLRNARNRPHRIAAPVHVCRHGL